ncbi:hypothetical protein [Umezawaea sp.]|uniref:hypothetical protein n=1 Tax=Umezawaea sp. TaxID=1955258 RepID=UPI002ED167BB
MFPVLQAVLAVLSLLCVTWSLVLIAANKPLLPLVGAKRGLVGLLAALEIGLLVQAVVGVVQMPGLDGETDRLSFLGYLAGPPLILPVAVVWSAAERTRWSAGVLAAACFSVPVMVLRLGQLWAGHA